MSALLVLFVAAVGLLGRVWELDRDDRRAIAEAADLDSWLDSVRVGDREETR